MLISVRARREVTDVRAIFIFVFTWPHALPIDWHALAGWRLKPNDFGAARSAAFDALLVFRLTFCVVDAHAAGFSLRGIPTISSRSTLTVAGALMPMRT